MCIRPVIRADKRACIVSKQRGRGDSSKTLETTREGIRPKKLPTRLVARIDVRAAARQQLRTNRPALHSREVQRVPPPAVGAFSIRSGVEQRRSAVDVAALGALVKRRAAALRI